MVLATRNGFSIIHIDTLNSQCEFVNKFLFLDSLRCDAKSKAIRPKRKKKYLTHVYCMCEAPYLCYFEFVQLLALKMNQQMMRKTWIGMGTQTNTRIEIDVRAYGVCLFIVSHIFKAPRWIYSIGKIVFDVWGNRGSRIRQNIFADAVSVFFFYYPNGFRRFLWFHENPLKLYWQLRQCCPCTCRTRRIFFSFFSIDWNVLNSHQVHRMLIIRIVSIQCKNVK